MELRRVVVVGASLAGFRAAEELRSRGFDGAITMVGEESRAPYDRPPLSKQILTGEWGPERLELVRAAGELDLEWRLGTAATGLDLAGRSVALAGGEKLPYDGLVIATGAAARRLPGTDHLEGVYTLRTLGDCLAIRAELERGPQRVGVVGAGFIGAEVASSCRARGLDVSLIEAQAAPLEHVLGARLGGVVGDLHRDHGVDLRLGVGVVGIEGGDRVAALRLTDGAIIEVDVVVVGVGVRPNTSWLEGSGLTLDDGVLCDPSTLAAPGVVAAGDVARWPNRRFGEVMRVEHWANAVAMGAHAARRLLAGEGPAEPYTPVPWFWSDQYDRKIQLSGCCHPTDEMELVAGTFEARRFLALYGRAGWLVGALGMNMPAGVARWSRLIESGTRWEAARALARAEP